MAAAQILNKLSDGAYPVGLQEKMGPVALQQEIRGQGKLTGLIVTVAFVACRVGTVVGARPWRLSAARGFSPDA